MSAATSTVIRVALGQLEFEAGAVDRNVDRVVEVIAEAAADGADLVALPELFDVGYFAFDSYSQAVEPLDGPTLSRISRAASSHGLAVLAGSVVEDLAASHASGFETPADDGYANAAVF